MEAVKKDLLEILNQALELEHSARLQYSSRAKMITAALTKIEERHGVKGRKGMAEVNLRDENDAIAFYKWIRVKVREYRQELQDESERLAGEIHNVINEEQKHLDRLALFVSQLEEKVGNKGRREYPCKAENEYAIK